MKPENDNIEEPEKEASDDAFESKLDKELDDLKDDLSEEEFEELKEIMRMLENKYVKTSKTKKFINGLLGCLRRFIVFALSFIVAYGFMINSIDVKFLNMLYFIFGLAFIKATVRIVVNKIIKDSRKLLIYEISMIIVQATILFVMSYYNFLIVFEDVLSIVLFFIMSIGFSYVLNFYIMKYKFKRLMKGR